MSHHRPLGRSHITISAIGLGCWQFSQGRGLIGGFWTVLSQETANEIVATGQADIVLLARQLLRDPYWPLHAAKELGVEVDWPVQYERAR